MPYTDKQKLQTLQHIILHLAKEQNQKAQYRDEQEENIVNFCKKLSIRYEADRKELRDKIQPFINKNRYFFEDPSFLKITGKLKNENLHTLFLEYIWNSKHGTQNLLQFLQTIPELKNKQWLETIKEGLYKIDKECCTYGLKGKDEELNGMRIDLLIVDNKNKWVVCIENKVDTNIHNAGTTDRTQLEAYYKFCEKEYKKIKEDNKTYTYNKIYIVLSYNEITNKKKEWHYITYHQLFASLLQSHTYTPNPIVDDYLKALFQMLYNWDSMKDVKNGTFSQYTWVYQDFYSRINSK